ncbi:tyrosine-protein phosphatase non-receptor type 2 isoform X3 [Procambarus clarkii]|uniref:tyrosine-protein phosphatase non-receptor type 2 isoform X3 n=1 Tax=Procambarus clarkii TaxID=6728 RepID=UPI001E678EE9|nr:tyrosine-protein phosphatase non-receptor type 2-like isoform X3 [Procambarus clarkii]
MTDPRQIHAIESECKQLEVSDAWNQVYQRIRSEGTFDLPCTEAKAPGNRNLNRYRDVLPYDHSRIILTDSSTNYINASLVKVVCVNRSYILAQGPLSHTTPHFWLMVWQQKVKGIIMLNKIIEKNQIKCHQYWPLGECDGGEDTMVFSTVGLKVDLLNVSHHTHYNYSTLRLTEISSGNIRLILHFHYTTWPDFGVPQSPEAFYKFLNVVRASGVLERDVGPSVVHCSAGIGRSGTFCLVDTILMMLSKGLCGSGQGKVVEVLLDMRRQRMGLIQTHDQLRFSYLAIVYGAHKLIEMNDKDPCEESSSEEPSLADELPPQPPPRTDSLTRSMIENQLANELQDGNGSDTAPEDNTEDYEEEDSSGYVPIRPLPAEPPTDGSGHDTTLPTNPDHHNALSKENDVRRRKQRERTAATAAKVKAMVEKQRVNEFWQERKRSSKKEEEVVQVPTKRSRL